MKLVVFGQRVTANWELWKKFNTSADKHITGHQEIKNLSYRKYLSEYILSEKKNLGYIASVCRCYTYGICCIM